MTAFRGGGGGSSWSCCLGVKPDSQMWQSNSWSFNSDINMAAVGRLLGLVWFHHSTGAAVTTEKSVTESSGSAMDDDDDATLTMPGDRGAKRLSVVGYSSSSAFGCRRRRLATGLVVMSMSSSS
jgi:hypothetical protein